MPGSSSSHGSGTSATAAARASSVSSGPSSASAEATSAAAADEDVIGRLVGTGVVALRGRPAMVERQRGPVVDEPHAAPLEQVGIAVRPVHVAHDRVEPQHAAGREGIDREGDGVVVQGTGQEVDAEVQACARAQQVLHLLVGLAAGQAGVDVDEHELGDGQARGAGRARPRSPRRRAPCVPDRPRGTSRRRCRGRRPPSGRAGIPPRAAGSRTASRSPGRARPEATRCLGLRGRSSRAHDASHDPPVLADPPSALEALLLEERERRVVQERSGDLAALHVLGEALHRSATEEGDLLRARRPAQRMRRPRRGAPCRRRSR